MPIFQRLKLAISSLAICSVAFLSGTAQAAEKASKPRSQVATVPGDYIQLETTWAPVQGPTGGIAYLGMVVRLWPGEDRYDACVQAPYVGEHLLIVFNDKPLPREVYENDKKLTQAVLAAVQDKAGAGTYTKVQVFRDFVIPDNSSLLLTQTCK